ncbi:MAG: hypothetical protein SCH70_00375 [Candidatus Methanoperedens sp.]|nr:hypothetical protein [Candidatus Methanoperedens sp.]
MKHKRESMTNRISEKDATTSVISTGLKSLRMNLFSCEEKRQCDAAKHGAECLSIGNHSPKRKRTIGGLSMKRCSVTKQKPDIFYASSSIYMNGSGFTYVITG